MDNSQPKIAVDYIENVTVATITDEKILEQADVDAIEGSIMPLIDPAGTNLVIDFKNVNFLTSAALGLLIRISKKIYETKGNLRLCCITNKIYEVFKITRLDQVFEIYDERADALKSLDVF